MLSFLYAHIPYPWCYTGRGRKKGNVVTQQSHKTFICTLQRTAVTVTFSGYLFTWVHLINLFYTSLQFYFDLILYIRTNSTYTVGRSIRNFQGACLAAPAFQIAFTTYTLGILYSWFTSGLDFRSPVISCSGLCHLVHFSVICSATYFYALLLPYLLFYLCLSTDQQAV